MEKLFSTELPDGGQQYTFDVSFHDEAYYFQPANTALASFYIKREGDEWHTSDHVAAELKSAAVAALDKYLLSQH